MNANPDLKVWQVIFNFSGFTFRDKIADFEGCFNYIGGVTWLCYRDTSSVKLLL
jgi:hypothetical protein